MIAGVAGRESLWVVTRRPATPLSAFLMASTARILYVEMGDKSLPTTYFSFCSVLFLAFVRISVIWLHAGISCVYAWCERERGKEKLKGNTEREIYLFWKYLSNCISHLCACVPLFVRIYLHVRCLYLMCIPPLYHPGIPNLCQHFFFYFVT